MEAHEGVGQLIAEFVLDALFIHGSGHGVIDVEQCNGIAGDAGADVFAERAVNIHFARHGDTAGGKTGIDVAGLKAELLRECGPAFIRKGNVFSCALVLLSPVEKRKLKLCHPLKQIAVVFSLAHFFFHILANGGNTFVAHVSLIGNEQIKLGVFFHFHAQLI